MARKENKSKSDKISRSKEKETRKDNLREDDLESGDNMEEREKMSGNSRK